MVLFLASSCFLRNYATCTGIPRTAALRACNGSPGVRTMRTMLQTTAATIQQQCHYLSTTTTKKKKARVVVVGSGRMGEIRSKLIYANPKMELIGIVDRNLKPTAQAMAEEYDTKAYSSLSELVAESVIIQDDTDVADADADADANANDNKPDIIDGIVCCTPTNTHTDIIQQALALRQPNLSGIFVEKPIDESASKITAVFDMIRGFNTENNGMSSTNPRGPAPPTRLQLCCGFQRRFDISYQQLLQHASRDSIGKILNSTIFFGDHPGPSMEFLIDDGGGDIFMDLSAHDVDFILQVMKQNNTATADSTNNNNDDADDADDADVISVYATGTSSLPELEAAGIHDNATMVLNFRDGAVATIFMSRSASYGYDQRCEIFGSAGMVQVGNIHATSTIVKNTTGIHHSKYQHSFPQRFAQAFENEMDAFADTVLAMPVLVSKTKEKRNDSRCYQWPITEQDCIKVQQIVDAAQESCKTGRVVQINQHTLV